jgi:hypothetical protein
MTRSDDNDASARWSPLSTKRFVIQAPYEGPPIETRWGFMAGGGHVEVEKYDDEFTARVRVAVLNHGLKKKKYTLWEQVEDGDFVEVDDADVDGEEAEDGR